MKIWSWIAAGLMLTTAATAQAQETKQENVLDAILNPTVQASTGTQKIGAEPVYTPPPLSETDFIVRSATVLPNIPVEVKVFGVDTQVQVVNLDGRATTTVLSAPVGSAPVAAVLIIPGIEGLDTSVRSHAETYARRGMLALVADLYGGETPKDRRDAVTRLRKLDRDKTLARFRDAETWLSSKTKFGKLDFGVAGYGLGAQWAMALASEQPRPAAVAVYYGIGEGDLAPLRQSGVPLIGFFSKQDVFYTPERVAAFQNALKSAGVNHEVISYHVEPNFAIEPRNGAARNYAASAVERTVNLIVAQSRQRSTTATAQTATTATQAQ